MSTHNQTLKNVCAVNNQIDHDEMLNIYAKHVPKGQDAKAFVIKCYTIMGMVITQTVPKDHDISDNSVKAVVRTMMMKENIDNVVRKALE